MTDHSELVKKLRDLHRDPRPASAEWLFENQVALYDSAAAIEELQAEVKRLQKEVEFSESSYDEFSMQAAVQNALLAGKLPKQGEWIVREVDIPGEIHPVAFRCMCSMCRNEYVFPRIPQYCPDCGSMNTAKMEVQDA